MRVGGSRSLQLSSGLKSWFCHLPSVQTPVSDLATWSLSLYSYKEDNRMISVEFFFIWGLIEITHDTLTWRWYITCLVFPHSMYVRQDSRLPPWLLLQGALLTVIRPPCSLYFFTSHLGTFAFSSTWNALTQIFRSLAPSLQMSFPLNAISSERTCLMPYWKYLHCHHSHLPSFSPLTLKFYF